MNENTIEFSYKVLDAKKQSFFELSSQFSDIAPFRRILSILRLKGVCKTIIIGEVDAHVDGATQCSGKSNNRSCDSCQSYIRQMQDNPSSLQLKKKKCSKIFFFSCKVDSVHDLSTEAHQEKFLGYCIIHQDTLINMMNGGEQYVRSYVPESVLKKLARGIRGYKYGNITCGIEIDNKPFHINKGNYFSQQNGITNCCAHAAIKTALRGYDESISCGAINDALIARKKSIEGAGNVSDILEITRMARGLTPNEMLESIRDISRKSKAIAPLDPFLITAHDLPISSFVETIYRAIESKLPVILLFRIPDNVAMANSFSGHAVSLVGHTFNEHNWCAYGSGYFSANNKESYLSSYLWCDNYVVQDDNFGPAYQLPCSFLSDYYEYGVSLEKLGLNIASQKTVDNINLNYPLAAIVIPPTGIKNVAQKLDSIERIAAKYFVDQINVFSRDNVLNMTKEEKELFDRYFYYIFNYRFTKPRVFITRTLLTSKEEYLQSSVKDIYGQHSLNNNSLLDVLDKDILSDYFWLTEVSVPELYWVNNHKIGEIIINIEDGQQASAGIQLVRLPFFLALYPKGESVYYPIHLSSQPLSQPHVEILRKKKGIIRQFNL